MGALPDTLSTPFVGAFLAVNGHMFLEYGVRALDQSYFDADMWLGLIGPVVYFVCIQYLSFPPIVCRVLLIGVHVVLMFAQEDLNALSNKIINIFNGKTKPFAGFFQRSNSNQSVGSKSRASAAGSASKAESSTASRSGRRGRSRTPRKSAK